MDADILRLECLKLAHQALREGRPDPQFTAAVVERARAYADFVTGTRDAEIIGAARGLARSVRDNAVS